MHLEHLSLSSFRNIDALSFDVSSRFVLVRGPNAQGKTNLLEALYLCATGKSFRQAAPKEWVQHGKPTTSLKGRFVRHDVRHDVELKVVNNRRSLAVDGRSLKQRTKLLELVNVVAFFPDDLRIVKGSPEERRRFLDRAVANHRPEFVTATAHYQKTLKSRNALLRQPKKPSKDLLGVYDEQLVQHGALMHQCRVETLEGLAVPTKEYLQTILSDTELTLGLENGLKKPVAPGDFSGEFHRALSASYAKDCARGITTVGPHRADLAIELDGAPARAFASQGQQRSIVLSLKMAELDYLTTRIGTPPILLLDDVSSELDSSRTQALFDCIAKGAGQVWISSTGTAPLPLPGDTQVLEMRNGALLRATA